MWIGKIDSLEGDEMSEDEMSVSDIRAEYHRITRYIDKLNEKHREKVWLAQLELRHLEKKCPHENTDAAQYLRWCNDCGWSRDTT